MPRWLRHLLFLSMLIVFGGCAGSCTSCGGCGITPIPGGFPMDKRVENSSSVRVTQSGLQFISQNLGPIAGNLVGGGGAGALTFEVPSSSQNVTVGKVNICPDGPKPGANPPSCIVEADLSRAKLTLATAAPHNLTVRGTLAVRLRSLPVKGTGLLIWVNSEIALVKNKDCGARDYADIPVDVDVSIQTDTDPGHGSRRGYSKLKVNKVDISEDALTDSFAACGGGLDDTILDSLSGILAGQIMGPLTDTLTDTIDEQLCTQADPAAGVSCPAGTYPDSDGTCRYCTPDGNGQCPSSAECVGMALGTDGKVDLGQMLASVSPGTKGGLDFLAALGGEGQRDDGSGQRWGDLNPVNNGMTVGMLGGAEPDPITTCVPIANLVPPTGIPIPNELTENSVSRWTGDGPHVGIAVSERYMNYALAGAYNSGALCLGIGSSTLGSLLSSNTVSLLIPSLKDLGRQQKPQPLSLVIRPQEPPTLQVGNGTDIETDPLLKLGLNKFIIDFYVFSSDRYIRAFSASFDLVVPVNLDVTDAGLAPVIDKLQVNNPLLSNAPLLREDEKQAAEALAGIISGAVGSALGGAIDPIDLNEQLASTGLTLNIPPSVPGEGSPGLRRLDKGSDGFLGIFAAFGVATPQPLWISRTEATVSGKEIDPAGLVLPTITRDNLPKVELRLSSQLDNGARTIEYQYRLDGGFWHPWTTNRNVTVSSPLLSLQAHHKLEVRSRVAGQPGTMDRAPAVIDLIIDKSAPEIALGSVVRDGRVKAKIFDVVSPAERTRVRWSLDGAGFSDWRPASALDAIEVGDATRVTVEATDEEGNLGTATQALVRGRTDASLGDASSCGCRVPGGDASGTRLPLTVGVLLGLGLMVRMRRRGGRREQPFRATTARRGVNTLRAAGTLALMAVAASWSGCSCGSDAEGGNPSSGGGGGSTSGQCPGLETCETITPGLVGAYSSVGVASDGTVWISGYDDIGYTQVEGEEPAPSLFGDLVVGKWDGTKVDWVTVDGLPPVDPEAEPGSSGGPPDPNFYDPKGFRQGLTEPGDDVGLWTSLQLDAAGNPMVAYYDATNRALKFASYDGSAWAVHTVQKQAHADLGRYAKLIVSEGKPLIAYLAITQDGQGGAQSGVRIATASSAAPAAESDWSFEDATVAPNTPCRDYLCNSGESCRADTQKCAAPISGCDPSCASGTKCMDDGAGTPKCVDVIGSTNLEDYPEASGLYLSIARGASGLALVFYDRIHGNLMSAQQVGGAWQPPAILDGQGTDSEGKPIDTGDKGIGASLFIDAGGDWHITYADGFTEALLYMKVTGGTAPAAPEVVDSGETPDGQSVVGDDSSLFVTSGGEVHVAYQDATNGLLRYAVGSPAAAGGAHTWNARTLTVDGFAGAFSHIVQLNGATQVSTWWRKGKPLTAGDVVLVAP